MEPHSECAAQWMEQRSSNGILISRAVNGVAKRMRVVVQCAAVNVPVQEPPSGAVRSERSRPVHEFAQRMSRKGNSAAHSEWRFRVGAAQTASE